MTILNSLITHVACIPDFWIFFSSLHQNLTAKSFTVVLASTTHL